MFDHGNHWAFPATFGFWHWDNALGTLGLTDAAAQPLEDWRLLPKDEEHFEDVIRESLHSRQAIATDVRIIDPVGHVHWIRCQGNPDPDGAAAGIFVHVGDLKAGQENLVKMMRVIDQTPCSVVVTDARGNIEFVNPKLVEMTGYTAVELIGQNPRLLQSGLTPPETYRDMWRTLHRGDTWQGELMNRKKSGEFYWESVTVSPVRGPDGKISHFIGIKQDITERKRYEERLHLLSHHDPLTALPKREMVVRAAAARDDKAMVLVLDVDRFKTVNDTLGHDAADHALFEVAARLKKRLQGDDLLGRLAGDEFIVLSGAQDVEQRARELLEAFHLAFHISGHEIFLTASIGIAQVGQGGGESAIRQAVMATHQAKREGGNRFAFASDNLDQQVLRRFRIDGLLRGALDRNEFSLNFQPLVEPESNHIIGAEALLRWNNAELGRVAPDEFIPVLEDSGHIVQVGQWVLEQACHFVRRWRDQSGSQVRVAVNVSGVQLVRSDLPAIIEQMLVRHHLPADALEIEITERVLLDDTLETMSRLQQLRSMGIRLSIDDFGTGYSSLSYLTRFPVDVLKIDRSFVRSVNSDPQHAALTQGIIALAKGLSLEVVAEGVEDGDHLEFLRQKGCDFVQGYLFSPPVDLDGFWSLLERSRCAVQFDRHHLGPMGCCCGHA